RRLRAVVEGDNVGRQSLLRLHQVCLARVNESGDLVDGPIRQQLEPLTHQSVGDAHGLVELRLRGFADADVVAQALTHAAHAVEATQDRQGDADLWRLTSVALQVTAHHQTEELLAPAQLDIGADLDRVTALHQWVEALVQVDGRLSLETFGEVVALQHPLHGDLARQGQHIEKTEPTEPVAV